MRQTSVEVPPTSKVMMSRKPAALVTCTAPVTPAAGPDTSVPIGRCPASCGEAKPPFDCWICGAEPKLLHPRLQPIEIAAHHRPKAGIEHRGAGALIFAEFSQHLVRGADELAGQRLPQPIDHGLLVLRI